MPSNFRDSEGFTPSRECVEGAVKALEANGHVNCIQLAHIAAGAQRYLDMTAPTAAENPTLGKAMRTIYRAAQIIIRNDEKHWTARIVE